MSSNNDHKVNSLSTFIYQAFKVRKQTDAPADRQSSLNFPTQSQNDWQGFTITYTSANSLCIMVWLGGLGSRVWSAGPWGLFCGMWAWSTAFRDPNWWSTISGSAWMGSLVDGCVSAFREDSWASADRALWSAFFARLLFNSLEYHVCSVETNTIFLTQLHNLETL